ncbi:hypothetical protein H263_06177, partial [Brachyspira hampsonii 30599]
MKNVFILAIILIIFASSCKKEYGTEYSIYEYEKYISKLIANRDTLEFTANFLQSLDENIINTLNEMTLVYELTPANIIES